MTEQERIAQARALLETVTPLKRDCGTLCGAACCQDTEDGEILGMELFPGERALYERKGGWYKLYTSPGSTLFVCAGTCPRDQRPLACRIFPLTPYVKNGRLLVRTDPRSAAVCPLYASGKRGLDPDFVKAVAAAMALLWESPVQREYLNALTARIDAGTAGL